MWSLVVSLVAVAMLLTGCRVIGAAHPMPAGTEPAVSSLLAPPQERPLAGALPLWPQPQTIRLDDPPLVLLRQVEIRYTAEAEAALAAIATSRAISRAVELRVIVDNRQTTPTESTSIAWEPWFAGACTFVGSDPEPWRVRRDEHGWGVLDTAGILPEQFGTFRIWFVAEGDCSASLVRVAVVAGGDRWVGETIASGSVFVRPDRLAAQRLFEQGRLPAILDALPLPPQDSRGVLPWIVAFNALVGLIALSGLIAAYRGSRG